MASHPLDSLSARELEYAVSLIKNNKPAERVLFEQVRLLEPDKQVVRQFSPGDPIARAAFAVVLDRDSGYIHEAIVDLDKGTLTSWEHIPDVQCCILGEECVEMAEVIKQNPDFLNALEKRGIHNTDQVSVEMFAMANFTPDHEKHLRLSRAHCFYVESPGDNAHVRPIEGLSPVVNLNTMEVLRIEDFGVVPITPDKGAYLAEQQPHIRAPLADLDITQPNGPEFDVDGHHVSWQNWNFRVGFTPKEGLVLHTLSFKDGDENRPVMYRASLSELVVPYADTAGDHYMNHSFDLGEGLFGSSVNALKLGCDCLGEIYYFDANITDGHGNVRPLPNAICMHEEDYGVLWKHTDPLTGRAEVRRSRRLVVSSFFTIGNYDYGLFWYLYLDGTIQFEAKLTGMLYTRAIADENDLQFGTLVAPNLNGMVHEHYFNLRLDMSIDGDANSVIEVEADRVPAGDMNPHGNAHSIRQTVIETEKESGRDINPADSRYWKIINPNRKNSLGWNTGYKLVPGPNVKPMHQPGSAFLRRAGFIEHDLWVTAYDPKEIHAPGEYLNQNEYGPGLPQWTQAGRPLVNEDIVLWHTVGLMHVPRPEDYPVMPVEYIGFMMKPIGFFDRNPTLDLAPPACHSK